MFGASSELASVMEFGFVSTAEPPSFLESPAKTLTVAEGQSATFTCSVHGAPTPTLIWQKGEALIDVYQLHDQRITVLPSGNLVIQVFRLLAFHSKAVTKAPFFNTYQDLTARVW